MINFNNEIPEKILVDGREFSQARWYTLYDSNGEFKASSSSTDLLQFYEPGDQLFKQYFREEIIAHEVTEYLTPEIINEWVDDE